MFLTDTFRSDQIVNKFQLNHYNYAVDMKINNFFQRANQFLHPPMDESNSVRIKISMAPSQPSPVTMVTNSMEVKPVLVYKTEHGALPHPPASRVARLLQERRLWSFIQQMLRIIA